MQSPLFSQIIGHTNACTVLRRMIETNTIPHAFLFVGPHHIGKTLIAKQLISSLFPDSKNMASNPDFIKLGLQIDEKTLPIALPAGRQGRQVGKKKSAISVEQVREVCNRLSLSSMNGGWKVAFIKEANALSTGAANALLKTLEEPTGKTLLILRAPSVESVLPTIASRCQILRFYPVDRVTLTDALIKKGFDKSDAQVASAISLGRVGRALRYLTKSEDRAQTDVSVVQALELLGAEISHQMRVVAQLLPKEDVNKRAVASEIIKHWQGTFRDVLLEKIGCDELIAHINHQLEIQTTSKCMNVSDTVSLLRSTEESRSAIYHNVNPLLALEHILLKRFMIGDPSLRQDDTSKATSS